MFTNFTRFTSSTRFTSFTSYLAHRWADFRAFFDEICSCSCFFWPSPPSAVSRKMPISGGFGSSSWETHCLIADCIFRVSADSSTPVRDLGEKICVSCERFAGQWRLESSSPPFTHSAFSELSWPTPPHLLLLFCLNFCPAWPPTC